RVLRILSSSSTIRARQGSPLFRTSGMMPPFLLGLVTGQLNNNNRTERLIVAYPQIAAVIRYDLVADRQTQSRGCLSGGKIRFQDPLFQRLGDAVAIVGNLYPYGVIVLDQPAARRNYALFPIPRNGG